MKKFLSILCGLLLISSLAFSQDKVQYTFTSDSNKSYTDTIVNATPKNQSSRKVASHSTFGVQVIATKISGTTAGVIRLFGSMDGTNWYRVTATGTLSAADSLNLANVAGAQTKVFFDVPSRYLYYQVRAAGSGTQSTKITSRAIASK